jgi:hypothetical protein
MTMPIEPPGGYPGETEGAWAGEPGAVLEGGGQIGSRGVGDLDPLHGQPSRVNSIGQWPPADFGPKLYTFDAAGRRTAVPPPGE